MLAPLVLLALLAAPAPLECGPYTCRHFATPREAFSHVLAARPRVLGLGEYHVLEDGPKVKSAIKRFTESLLPLLKGRASDLIAETWITQGRCGKVERQATEQIERDTRRPAETEDEVTTMLKRASSLGIEPHILVVECEDYEDVLDERGELDHVQLLQLVTRLLREKAEKLAKMGDGERAVVIYGGALHNDLAPSPDLAGFSFGPALAEATKGRYLQLGLYVPELVERDDEARRAPWFPHFERHRSRTRTLLITLGPGAHLLFFPTSARPATGTR